MTARTDGVEQAKIETIREVFQYLRQFKGRTFVIKIDYTVIDDPHFPVFIRDVARLYESGIRIVLVPGAKERIDQILGVYNIADRVIQGVRATSSEAMPFIMMAAFDVANRLMTRLSGTEIDAVIGNWIRARGMGVVDGVDYQSAGLVERVLTDRLRNVMDNGFVPILPCIGWNSLGQPYNIASNDLAVITASRLGAEKLFFVTSGPDLAASDYQIPDGPPLSEDGRISNFSLPDLEEFFRLNPDREGLELLAKARRACEAGVARVHILDGRSDGVLLKEVFSNLGSGTMVYSNRYSGIRPMRQDETIEVLRIMKPFVEKGILLPRNAETLAENYEDFIVFEVDDAIRASAALHRYPEGVGEIAAVAVDRQYAHLGVGPRLIGYLLDRARRQGLSRVFVLTTQTGDWFLKQGFQEGDLSSLPEKKRALYDLSRRSRIFTKDLS